MGVLLSTIGSRGEVEPLLALALELRARHQDVGICAPPDFADRIESLSIPFVPIGPHLRPLTAYTPGAAWYPAALAGWAVSKGRVYGFSQNAYGLVGACQVFNRAVPAAS
jgi:UDP:flavonoid glycosyltransferase YjiC (YdhE family)